MSEIIGSEEKQTVFVMFTTGADSIMGMLYKEDLEALNSGEKEIVVPTDPMRMTVMPTTNGLTNVIMPPGHLESNTPYEGIHMRPTLWYEIDTNAPEGKKIFDIYQQAILKRDSKKSGIALARKLPENMPNVADFKKGFKN